MKKSFCLLVSAVFVFLAFTTVYAKESFKQIIPCKYDNIGLFEDGIAPALKGGKWGFIDVNDNVIIDFKFDQAKSFSEGLSPVNQNGKWGYIDKKGNTVIPFKFFNANPFKSGVACVDLGQREWVYINKKGELITKESFQLPNNFSDGLGLVGKNINNNYTYGFVDSTGRMVIPYKYVVVKPFDDGMAGVSSATTYSVHTQSNGKWGFIDKNDKLVIPYKFDEVDYFNDGIAAVKINGKWGYIDKTGNTIIEAQFEEARAFYEGLAAVKKGGKFGYIDITGNTVIDYQFDTAWNFHEGLSVVKQGDKWGYIDKSGKNIIPYQFEACGNFSNGRAAVILSGKYGYIGLLSQGQSTYEVTKTINVTVYDVKVNFDTPPIIKNGRTLVPLRAILEALNATIDWDDSSKCLTSTFNGRKISIFINSTTAYVDDTEVSLDVAPEIIEGRTMLPVRFVAESFGLEVIWDGDSNTVKIQSS